MVTKATPGWGSGSMAGSLHLLPLSGVAGGSGLSGPFEKAMSRPPKISAD